MMTIRSIAIVLAASIFVIPLYAQEPPFDTVSYESISISCEVYYNDSKEEVVAYFGDPDDVKEFYREMDKITEIQYIYESGIEMRFVDGGLKSFRLRSSDHFVTLDGIELRVGNTMESLADPFPKTYGHVSGAEGGVVVIGLGVGDHDYLRIQFDDNHIITDVDQRVF